MRPSSAYTGFGTVLTLVVVVLASFEVSLHGVAAQCGADGDLDSDNVCNNVDSCAFDPGNDMDSDSLCALVCEFTTAGVTTDVTTTSSSATITTTDTTTTARITTTSTDRPTPSTTTSAGRTATTSTDRITDRTTSGDVRDTTSTTRAVTRKTTSATRGGGRTTDRSTTTTIIRRDTTSATRIDRSTTVTDRVTRPPVTSTTVPQRSTTSGTGRISTRSTTTTRPVRSTSSTELPTRRPTTGAGGAETTPSRQLATTRGAGTTAGFYARFNGRTSCADNGYCIIDSVAECETAGAATSTDGSAPVASEVDSALKPAGCFINTAGALRFNTLLDSTAEGSTTNEVVCMMCVVGTTPRGGNGVASTPRGGFPAVTTPRGGVPAVTTPRGGIPAVTTPRGGVVADTTPRGGVVADTTPRGGVVADTTPRGGVVADTTPRGGVVVDTTRRGDVRTTSSARGRTTARSTTTTDGRQTRTTTDERGGRTTAGRGDPTTTSVRGGRTTTTSTRRGRPTSATSTRGAPTTSTTGRGRPILTTRPVRAASRLLADTFKINGFTCMEPDLCPGDALNDIDSDGVCGDEDSCPFDPNNDADGDGGCDDACLSNSCFEQSCDEWIYSHGLSCELLEDTFGCSCYGCSCKPMECSGACKVKAWFGDNVCDDVNNNCGCGWDGGDCCGPVNMEIGGKNDFTYCDDCRCLDPSSELDAKDCPGTKTCDVFGYMADFFCDDGNNNCGCAWDGGDCCGASVDTSYCTECSCSDPAGAPTNSDVNKPCDGTCTKPFFIGDNFCDDENNKCACNWDNGDCCGGLNTFIGSKNSFTLCSECLCLDPTNRASNCPTTGPTCAINGHAGDGICDDGNNNCGCNWDGGDCCGAGKDYRYCKDCKCLDPESKSYDCPGNLDCAVAGFAGDGICDDNNNNCGCDWDHGDCCGTAKSYKYCQLCVCHEK